MNIEQFFVTLLERLFATLWNEFQTWISKPGNFEVALQYLDDILTNAGIQVTPAPSNGTPATPPSAPPAAAASVQSTPAAPLTPETKTWFSGRG